MIADSEYPFDILSCLLCLVSKHGFEDLWAKVFRLGHAQWTRQRQHDQDVLPTWQILSQMSQPTQLVSKFSRWTACGVRRKTGALLSMGLQFGLQESLPRNANTED